MGNTKININQGNTRSKEYQGKNKIYYVFNKNNYLPSYSGTLEMCQAWINDKGYLGTINYSLDHRPFRPEFK